jgi:NAD(P)-dependent dehydrogenase (short-subunit alcohol dehydrogenase family)
VALQLAADGCSVAINFVSNRRAADETSALCRSASASKRQVFQLIQGDIGSRADRTRIVAETLAEFGRIDALVNNAGVAPSVRSDLMEATEESFDEIIGTNLRGPYFLTQAVARYWLKERPKPALSGGFKVVFLTSVSADTASVDRGDYCLSKAGLAMAAKLWSARLAADNIQVIEVRPGIMATDMTSAVKKKYDLLIEAGLVPQRRWGTGNDVGLVVGAIMAGRFPFSTGSVIHVDGGLHVSRL